MKREEVLSIVNEIFVEIFGNSAINLDDDISIITDETTYEDIEDWDSFEQINIISLLEKRFSMKFKADEIYSINNVGEMIDIIMERGNY